MSDEELWDGLRRHTVARIGLGHVGGALPTARLLVLRAAHAAARDAVHAPADLEGLRDRLDAAGLTGATVVRSRAVDRSEYLRRPDLGRVPAGLDGLPRGEAPDVALVVCDGLSARAVDEHAVGVAVALRDALGADVRLAPPVLVEQGRVGIGDHVGHALDARAVVVLVGERPGLSVADSLGAYLTWDPRPGRADSERNCVSNIHARGLSYRQAGHVLASLYRGARELGRSGVDLKDTSTVLETPTTPEPLV